MSQTENSQTATETPQTESELISRAQFAVSQCNWTVGECAAQWTMRYAKGRTDADFGQLVGLSGDQVYQRRRVWETFGDVRSDYASLKWSHFYISLNWDDSPECLQWAEENQATIAELKTWRRALHGTDLVDDSPPDPWGGDPSISFVPTDPVPVRDVGDSTSDPGDPGDRQRTGGEDRPQKEANEVAYAPYRSNAGSAPDSEQSAKASETESDGRETEQLVKRITTTLERISKTLSPTVLEEIGELPEDLQQRFLKAIEEVHSKAGQLVP